MLHHVKILLLEVTLLAVCLLGDHGPQNRLGSQIVRLLSDSLTHGLVGGVSWSIVCNIQLKGQDIMECVICLLIASFVDVDHFLAARSFLLKDALSLPTRPPFHATTLIFAVDIVLFMLVYRYNTDSYKKFILMFNIGWLSHHIRDASRRGLWMYPFGETLPLSKLTYLGLILCLPLLFRLFHFKWISQRSISDLKGSQDCQV